MSAGTNRQYFSSSHRRSPSCLLKEQRKDKTVKIPSLSVDSPPVIGPAICFDESVKKQEKP